MHMGSPLFHIQVIAMSYFHMPDLKLYTVVNSLGTSIIIQQCLCSDSNILLHFALIT